MIGFWLVNLVIPGEPETLQVRTPCGAWQLSKAKSYAQTIAAIPKGQCGVTYAIEHPASIGVEGAAACDAVLDEMTPLLLGSSYLTGRSVTANRSLPSSDISVLQMGSHWPRERPMGESRAASLTDNDFQKILQDFVKEWPRAAREQKMLLLIHHWLDSLSCSSFEDLYLSATTLLQIIAATEADAQGQRLTFFEGVTDASARAQVAALSEDFKDMRNNLIHEGSLLGGRYSGTGIADCATVATDVLNWFDEYVFSVMSLGPTRRRRFLLQDLMSLNSYSIPWP